MVTVEVIIFNGHGVAHMSPHLLFNGGKMFYLNKKMKEFGTIRVSIVGLGLMGGSLLDQLLRLEGFRPTIVAARDKNLSLIHI